VPTSSLYSLELTGPGRRIACGFSSSSAVRVPEELSCENIANMQIKSLQAYGISGALSVDLSPAAQIQFLAAH